MKILVLGGTVFLGRHITQAACAAGYEVTLFNRGKTHPGLFPGLETVIGDRRTDLNLLRGRDWDAVIDTCGYHPGVVRASAEFFQDKVPQYVFISSVSVYEEWGAENREEAGRLVEPLYSDGASAAGEAYGRLKLACERVVREILPGRTLAVRPGLIAGPFDPTDRFTYWPVRVARGGEVLAPGDPERTAQAIDVRDLAEWIVRASASREAGAFNACGPDVPMKTILYLCREVTGSDATLAWVDDKFLLREGVTPYTDLPLWIPGAHDRVDTSKAQSRGLAWRPFRDTLRDTWAWASHRAGSRLLRSGLSPDKEAELLALWKKDPDGVLAS